MRLHFEKSHVAEVGREDEVPNPQVGSVFLYVTVFPFSGIGHDVLPLAVHAALLELPIIRGHHRPGEMVAGGRIPCRAVATAGMMAVQFLLVLSRAIRPVTALLDEIVAPAGFRGVRGGLTPRAGRSEPGARREQQEQACRKRREATVHGESPARTSWRECEPAQMTADSSVA